ncbi:GNAT family N-acetyltransferase [Allokutzneria sp. A3M-2-11 16]|uniref:GNAT family N-acetyltransferase n=1 Tax=Allokutzneria sp. A3M-2-11 16 TaxID=2962043 RepID=UPI0020B801FB|nr:GNAT family N-acetyltransferase [Allokutzneria sp. A3M-2-11 16]MCP3799971.1 GNAT family N-acetyltransferase [Allokutzneria sp. A3M-2-11 16]
MVTVRVATAADLSALLVLYKEFNPEDPDLSIVDSMVIWAEMAAQGRIVLVAERDGAIAGTLDCAPFANLTRGGRPILNLENMVVGEAHRRHGVGRALISAAVELARQRGCYKLQLLSVDSEEAHAFYESCGFRHAARGYRFYL